MLSRQVQNQRAVLCTAREVLLASTVPAAAQTFSPYPEKALPWNSESFPTVIWTETFGKAPELIQSG